MRIKKTLIAHSILCLALVSLAACSESPISNFRSSGALSGVRTIDSLMKVLGTSTVARKSGPLGVFVSEYLSNSIKTSGLLGGLSGIQAQEKIFSLQESVGQPDFDLLQAFADALQVDVSDLLNRSDDRQKALDAYSEALTNVAERANLRYKELIASEDTLDQEERTLTKERSALDREVKAAVKAKNFTEASEKQKLLSEKETTLSETSLKLDQVRDLIKTLEDLLSIYEERITAIKKNREALITGVTVVDVPGIEELKVIERTKKTSTRRRGEAFDDLFQDTNVP